MQQMLTSTPSKYDIHQSSIIESKITANPCLQKKGKKFFTPEKIMVFIFFIVFITYQIFYKKIFFKEIHIPLHATHFNISYNEEKILIEEVEENLIQKFSIFLLEFLVYCYLFAFLFFLVIGHRDDEFFMGFVVFCCCLLYANYNNLSYDLMQNQKQAFIFKKDLKNLLEKIPTNRNKNSILSINRYNREVDSYNLSIQKIEDFLKKEKNYFKNYVIAQALINLDQENIHIKYVKAAADYFIQTPLNKLDFFPKEDVVFNIESKAYGRAISPLAKRCQSSISDSNTNS